MPFVPSLSKHKNPFIFGRAQYQRIRGYIVPDQQLKFVSQAPLWHLPPIPCKHISSSDVTIFRTDTNLLVRVYQSLVCGHSKVFTINSTPTRGSHEIPETASYRPSNRIARCVFVEQNGQNVGGWGIAASIDGDLVNQRVVKTGITSNGCE